jgi:molybdate transport system regulatory protein
MKTSPLKLHSALGHEAADKRIDILRRIGDVGSISEAARAAGVSYKAAWQAIDTLSNLAGSALVESAVGGAGGGGAHLTAEGQYLLRAADEMALARSQVLARLAARKGGAVQPAGVAALGLRTSMRNQLPCTVKALKRQGAVVRVELALADGTPLASRITRESAQLLALAPGLAVLALCKATGVQVATSARAAPGRNLLAGRVTRAARLGGGEVALALGSGLQLVGFAGLRDILKVRSAAVASVDEAAVVLAVSG